MSEDDAHVTFSGDDGQKEFDVTIKFMAFDVEGALALVKANLSDNAIEVARIVEVNHEVRLKRLLIEADLIDAG